MVVRPRFLQPFRELMIDDRIVFRMALDECRNKGADCYECSTVLPHIVEGESGETVGDSQPAELRVYLGMHE
jgi:hypothetical protein